MQLSGIKMTAMEPNHVPLMGTMVGNGKTAAGREFDFGLDLGGRMILCAKAEDDKGFGDYWIVEPGDMVEAMLRAAGLEE